MPHHIVINDEFYCLLKLSVNGLFFASREAMNVGVEPTVSFAKVNRHFPPFSRYVDWIIP